MRPFNFQNLPISLLATAVLLCVPGLALAQPATPTPTPTPVPTPQASPSAESGRPAQTPSEDEGRGPRDPMSSATFNGLRFRSLGPAFTSGRVIGFAVDPNNASKYFVAASSGGGWRGAKHGRPW